MNLILGTSHGQHIILLLKFDGLNDALTVVAHRKHDQKC